MPIFLENFCADETGLYYCATPNGFLCYKHIARPGYKKAMDHISVLCPTNMSGTDKRKLLIIRKSAKKSISLKWDSRLIGTKPLSPEMFKLSGIDCIRKRQQG